MRNYSNEYKKIASFENLIFSNVSILKGLYMIRYIIFGGIIDSFFFFLQLLVALQIVKRLSLSLSLSFFTITFVGKGVFEIIF